MGKKAIEVRKDEKEVVEEAPKSVKYAQYKALIASYKKQNPVKYEAKKDVLKARLALLK